MNFDQEKAGEGRNTLPVNEISPLNGLGPSVVTGDPKCFDNLTAAQAGVPCGQYPSGTQVPIAAPAATQHACWANLPPKLRALKAWCIHGPNGKAPLTANGYGASVTDPETWTDFHSACMAAEIIGGGIGFVLHAGAGVTCIDLDVKDDTPQEQIDRYGSICRNFDTYTEYSKSGRGLHIWALGEIGAGCRRDGVEVYSQDRFIICTGNVLHPVPMQDRQAMLDILVGEIRQEQQRSAVELVESGEVDSDEVIWNRATTASNADKFNELWRGDWRALGYPSQSEADLSLLSMLCFYSKSNAQVRRLFRLSGLGKREKAVKNDRYLDRTLVIIRARQEREDDRTNRLKVGGAAFFVANSGKRARTNRIGPVGALRLLGADEIAARPPMKWLVRGVLPEKGIGAIYGQPGSGKSFLVLDLLAAVSGGYHWFGIPTKAVPVVYITLEGQAGMPQRLLAYRAKKGLLDRIVFIEQSIDLRSPETLKELIDLIRDAGLDGGLVCIDTLAASAPGMDENASADMGQLIANLQDLQTELGGFVLVVHHSGKDEARGLRGWSGLNGALDCAISVSRVSEDKRSTSRRWEVSKSKDGSDGMKNDFALEQVLLDYVDGHPITSCVISHTMQEPVSATQTDSDDDEFLWNWVQQQVVAGNYPSKNSLKHQLSEMKTQRAITQGRVLASIERLLAESRLVKETNSPSGNSWLRAVECPGAGGEQPGSLGEPRVP